MEMRVLFFSFVSMICKGGRERERKTWKCWSVFPTHLLQWELWEQYRCLHLYLDYRDLKVPRRDHSSSFLPWLYNTLWSWQKPFGTTTDVTDPNTISPYILTLHYPQDWIHKCWSSFPASDALWHQWKSHLFSSPCEIPACLLTGWLKPCHCNAEREACCLLWPDEFWSWGHPLPQLQWSRENRRKGLCMRCSSKSGFVLHDKASAMTFCFLGAKGKWKGRTKRKRARRQSRERCTSSLNTLPGRVGLVITVFSPSAPSQMCCQSSKLALINRSLLSQT